MTDSMSIINVSMHSNMLHCIDVVYFDTTLNNYYVIVIIPHTLYIVQMVPNYIVSIVKQSL